MGEGRPRKDGDVTHWPQEEALRASAVVQASLSTAKWGWLASPLGRDGLKQALVSRNLESDPVLVR